MNNRRYSSEPTFVVSSVRSGSTLFRLMLNSHPGITNPGECDYLFYSPGSIKDLPKIDGYIKWLSSNRVFLSSKLLIDDSLDYDELIKSFVQQMSQPGNILTVNIHRDFECIPNYFPKARYIHLLRDPRDVARSALGMGWAGNVYYAVDIWRRAEESWDRLKSDLLPYQYLELKYEDLLSDPKGSLSIICCFLGVEYSESMLKYSEITSYDSPNVDLCYQWKSKYTKNMLQLVEGKISSLLLNRGYTLSGYTEYQPGIWTEKWLWIENKSKRIHYVIKKYGLYLYLEGLFIKKLGITSRRAKHDKKINEIITNKLK